MSVFSKKADNSWTQIKLVPRLNYKSWLRPRYSANFEIVGLFSAIEDSESYYSYAYFAKMDYSANTAIYISFPNCHLATVCYSTPWISDDTIQIAISDKYLYIIKPKI